MPERIKRAGEGVNVHTARDQLNRFAPLDNPALRNLRAQHAIKPLPALEAFRQAVALVDEPFVPRSTGRRVYWPTIEGERMRARRQQEEKEEAPPASATGRLVPE